MFFCSSVSWVQCFLVLVFFGFSVSSPYQRNEVRGQVVAFLMHMLHHSLAHARNANSLPVIWKRKIRLVLTEPSDKQTDDSDWFGYDYEKKGSIS